MSKLNERGNQNWENSATKRWQPQAGSTHYRVYKWWMYESGKRPVLGSRCHYWLVVFIWAPLRWLFTPLIIWLRRVWIIPWVLVPVTVLVLFIVNTDARKVFMIWLIASWVGTIVGTIVVGGFLLRHTLMYLAKHRRAQEWRLLVKPDIDEVMETMFEVLHPKWAGEADRFTAWKKRYVRYCRKTVGMHEYDMMEHTHIARLSRSHRAKVTSLLAERRSKQALTTR